MKFIVKVFMISCLAIASSFAMEESIKPQKSGVLTLINRTGSTLELSVVEHHPRPEGGWEVVEKSGKNAVLIGKNQSYNLPLDKTEKASLSFRTTYLGKNIVPVPLKEIKRETQGRDATLIIKAGGFTGSDIIIDLEKNLETKKPSEEPISEAEVSQLKELIVRNDALMNIFVRYHTEFHVSPQVLKGIPVITPPTLGMTTTWIGENKKLEIPLITKTPQGDLIKTLKVTRIEVAPAYAKDEDNRQYQESDILSGSIELPLERIKRKAVGHTAVVVPITRESGILTKTLKVDLDHLELS